MTLTNEDRALRNGFVFYRRSADTTNTELGQVLEILADAEAKRVVGLLVQRWEIGESTKPYRFPQCVPSNASDSQVFINLDVRRSHLSQMAEAKEHTLI